MPVSLPVAEGLPLTRSAPTQLLHTATRPFHVMTKPIGPICNLDCKYCFYLEKEALYDDRKWAMDDATLETYIRQYLKGQPGREVSFAWQGGEPTLLGVRFFRRVIELQQKHAGGRVVTNALQTNGTLLDDEWGAFLKEHGFLVGLSVDGPKRLHDTYRVDKQGRSTHDAVMRGAAVLKEHGVDFNTLTVVNAANVDHPLEVYEFLKEAGSGFMQFIPLVERSATDDAPFKAMDLWLQGPPEADGSERYFSPVTEWSVPARAYGSFLGRIFDEWVRKDVGSVFVQMFDVALGNWARRYLNEPGGSLCVFSETCGGALAVEHSGDVYSCDHYVYPQYKLGNLNEESLVDLVQSPRQRKFGRDKRDTLPRYCRECEVRFACHGECPKHRFVKTPAGEDGLNYLCPSYRPFFNHIDPAMKRMCQLLAERRPPAEIMGEIKAQSKKGSALTRRWPKPSKKKRR